MADSSVSSSTFSMALFEGSKGGGFTSVGLFALFAMAIFKGCIKVLGSDMIKDSSLKTRLTYTNSWLEDERRRY